MKTEEENRTDEVQTGKAEMSSQAEGGGGTASTAPSPEEFPAPAFFHRNLCSVIDS